MSYSNPTKTSVIGKGHHGHTPNLPVIRARPLTPAEQYAQGQGLLEPVLKAFKMGKVHIMTGWHPVLGFHMSISRPDHYPSWDEVAKARYELLPPDLEFGMMLPPQDQYINLHEYCFHLHEMPINWDNLPKTSNPAPQPPSEG